MRRDDVPGSIGEHFLQQRYGTTERASAFYRRQVLDHLNERMREFVARQEMVFVSTADARGECDCSFRAGEPGFVRVLDDRTLAYPEYRGNGVHASLGNILENRHIGLLFLDFSRDRVGLHVNGSARVIEHDRVDDERLLVADPRAERWVRIDVEEAYIHCSKHVPQMEKRERRIFWGTDDVRRKGGDYFGVAADRRAAEPGVAPPTPTRSCS